MCDVYWDDAEPNRCSTSGTSKARKEHKCDCCGLSIAPRERYRHTSGIDADGYPFSEKMCMRCEEAVEEYRKRHGGTWNASYMSEALDECLDDEPESKEWIGQFFELALDPDSIPRTGDDPEDFEGVGPRYKIIFDRPKPKAAGGSAP